MKAASVLAAVAGLSAAVDAASHMLQRRDGPPKADVPITVRGNAFWRGNDRFYIIGVDYQPGGSSDPKDPLADPNICKRDIQKFTDLNINFLRVYTVDNSADHTECMNALSDAGIYVAIDLSTPKYSLNRNDPVMSYSDLLLQSQFATIDNFIKFPNFALGFSSNEVINSDNTTNCAPYIKAQIRDCKQYVKARNYRPLPIGYSAADVESNRYELANYLNCGPDYVRSDFFGFNDYSWCDPSDFQKSGWDGKVKKFQDYSIPLFLSEFGCNTNKREFNELAALYSDKMTSVYSGGLVYEYSEEGSHYGLVTINGNDVQTNDDYDTLKKKIADLGTNGLPPPGDGGYKANGAPSQCPAKSKTFNVNDSQLPIIPAPALDYIKNGAGKPPGLTGAGSQWQGTPSKGFSTPSDSDPAAKDPTQSTSGDGKTGAATSIAVSPLSFALAVVATALFGSSIL